MIRSFMTFLGCSLLLLSVSASRRDRDGKRSGSKSRYGASRLISQAKEYRASTQNRKDILSDLNSHMDKYNTGSRSEPKRRSAKPSHVVSSRRQKRTSQRSDTATFCGLAEAAVVSRSASGILKVKLPKYYASGDGCAVTFTHNPYYNRDDNHPWKFCEYTYEKLGLKLYPYSEGCEFVAFELSGPSKGGGCLTVHHIPKGVLTGHKTLENVSSKAWKLNPLTSDGRSPRKGGCGSPSRVSSCQPSGTSKRSRQSSARPAAKPTCSSEISVELPRHLGGKTMKFSVVPGPSCGPRTLTSRDNLTLTPLPLKLGLGGYKLSCPGRLGACSTVYHVRFNNGCVGPKRLEDVKSHHWNGPL